MSLKSRIQNNQDGDFSWQLRRSFWNGLIMGIYGSKLTVLETEYKENVDIEIEEQRINITTKTREALVASLQIFGGKWNKEKNTWEETVIDYVQEIEHPLLYTFTIVCKGAPPPSCKIIEEDVEIPAHTIKRKRIECPKSTAEQPVPIETIEGVELVEAVE
jgi:hypothetical protein